MRPFTFHKSRVLRNKTIAVNKTSVSVIYYTNIRLFCIKMEHPHNLLNLVVKQHYRHRPKVLETANIVLQDYGQGKLTYEETLSNLYQLFNDLPSDITLYYLSTVTLPENQEVKSTSLLPGLMKQMLIPSYHNGMRPILLKYLNEKIPPLVPISKDSNETLETEKNKKSSQSSEDSFENKENIRSVIDDNIKQEKIKNKKAAKPKTRVYSTRNGSIKSLAILCANNIYKHHHNYIARYKKEKRQAWRLVHSDKCDKDELETCYKVIRDINKKIKWLSVIKTGHVPKEIIEEEYADSDVFFKERHLQSTVGEDLLDLDSEMLNSIKSFMSKC